MKNKLNIIDFFGMIKNKVFDLFKVNNNVDNDLVKFIKFGNILVIVLFFSAIFPLYKISYFDDEGVLAFNYYIYLFRTGFLFFAMICLIIYKILKNNKVYMKETNKQLTKPKWFLIYFLILCFSIIYFIIIMGIQDWSAHEGMLWPHFKTMIGTYIYFIGIVLLFVYWIYYKIIYNRFLDNKGNINSIVSSNIEN